MSTVGESVLAGTHSARASGTADLRRTGSSGWVALRDLRVDAFEDRLGRVLEPLMPDSA